MWREGGTRRTGKSRNGEGENGKETQVLASRFFFKLFLRNLVALASADEKIIQYLECFTMYHAPQLLVTCGQHWASVCSHSHAI